MANEKVGDKGCGVDVEGRGTEAHPTASECGCHVGKSVRFATGATRTKETTFDPEGFISPVVLQAYCEYMERHRVQADGKLRDSDNWQKGMPTSRAFRSLTRHFLDAWLIHRGYPPHSEDCGGIRDALCGMLFNVMLLLKNEADGQHHEEVK